VKQAPLLLHKAYMPRVLEMGFISNYVGEIYWTQSQNEITTAIANAIISYKMNITEQEL
jgi:N-acetylmuramoyl-L-alanine amidase